MSADILVVSLKVKQLRYLATELIKTTVRHPAGGAARFISVVQKLDVFSPQLCGSDILWDSCGLNAEGLVLLHQHLMLMHLFLFQKSHPVFLFLLSKLVKLLKLILNLSLCWVWAFM